MRAIVRSAGLFFVLAGFFVALAAEDPHEAVMDVLSRMAAALTGAVGANSTGAGARTGNVAEFMSAVSKEMPEYDTLQSEITALVRNAEVSSSITPLTEDVQADTYKIDLDWLLEIRSLEQDGPMERRREVVHCELRKEKKHWKVVSLKPLGFFAAAKPGQ
ncbi:MAG TPA: hypothetical protein VFW44_12390 [Bryobacteraceae bacterium]|nr:hypothetical protein [Bryobacteraceae bacterium]